MGLFSRAASNNVGYHPIYHPFNWRGWTDWASARSVTWGLIYRSHHVGAQPGLTYQRRNDLDPVQRRFLSDATLTFYEFPARGSMPPVKLTGTTALKPNKPEELGDEELKQEAARTHWQQGQAPSRYLRLQARLLPKSLHESFGKPTQKSAHRRRSPRNDWVDAAKGRWKPPARSSTPPV